MFISIINFPKIVALRPVLLYSIGIKTRRDSILFGKGGNQVRTTEAAKLMDTTPSIIKKLIKNGQIPPDCATYFPPAKDDTYPYYHINGPKFKEWLEGNAHVTNANS